MELNQFIFPAPTRKYHESELKELIRIPVYKEIKFQSSPLKPKAQFHQMNPFNPPEDIPHDLSSHSIKEQTPIKEKIKNYQSQQVLKVWGSNQSLMLSQSLSPVSAIRTIPTQSNQQSAIVLKYIPCLYLRSRQLTKKTIIYFHANSEDLKSCYQLLDFLRSYLRINVLCMEYPGYGIYEGQATEENIIRDAEYLYKYTAQYSKIGEQNVIVMGRSIGTGVATQIASKFNPMILVLISPFTSLRDVLSERYSLLSKLVKDRFINKEKIPLIKCPLFILHGLSDQFINVNHSKTLIELCKQPACLRSPEEVTHSRFNFEQDLALPLVNFMKTLNLYI